MRCVLQQVLPACSHSAGPCCCPCRATATGLLPNAITLLEAAQSALHYSEPGVGALLAAAQELLSLIKLGERLCEAAARSFKAVGQGACLHVDKQRMRQRMVGPRGRSRPQATGSAPAWCFAAVPTRVAPLPTCICLQPRPGMRAALGAWTCSSMQP